MPHKHNIQGPVVVTATGGSGTRVIAGILESLGGYMGGNLNSAKDNRDFAYCLAGNITEISEAFRVARSRRRCHAAGK